MEAMELRLLFVAGLLVLGGVALLIGLALSRMLEAVRSDRMAMPRRLAGPIQTSPVRHRMVTGRGYGEGRS